MQEITLSLTTKEWNYIIEALLFSGCSDICADWKDEESKELLDIAIKIKNNTSYKFKLNNLKLWETNAEYPLLVKRVKDNFDVGSEKEKI